MFKNVIDESTELRILEERHAGEVYALMSADLSRHPELGETFAVEFVKDKIRHDLSLHAESMGLGAGIWYNGDLAGAIRYHEIDLINRSTELGYWVGSAFEGKGLVTKACRAFIDHAFRSLDLNRIVISCAAPNLRSRAVPERLGFKQEFVARQSERLQGGFVDMVIYSLLKSEWSDRQSPGLDSR